MSTKSKVPSSRRLSAVSHSRRGAVVTVSLRLRLVPAHLLCERVFVQSRNHKGNVAELAIAAEAAKIGIPVLKPLTEHEPYDLVSS